MTQWKSIRRAAGKASATLHTHADAGALAAGVATETQGFVYPTDRYTESITVTLGTASTTGDVTIDVLSGATVLGTLTVPQDATSVVFDDHLILAAGEALTFDVTDEGVAAADIAISTELRARF